MRFAALKAHSNNKASRDIVVVVQTWGDPKPLMEPIRDWVLSRLPKHHPAVYSYLSNAGECVLGVGNLAREYHYRCVSGTRSVPSGEWHSGDSHNAVWVAVHLDEGGVGSPMHMDFNTGLVGVDDTRAVVVANNELPLPANVVMKCLSIQKCGKPWLNRMLGTKWSLPNDAMELVAHFLEPKIIRENVSLIAVSAVTPLFMSKLWREILLPNKYQNCFTHASLGYARAPMVELVATCSTACADCALCIDWRDELISGGHPAKTKEEAIDSTGEEPVGFHWQTKVERSRDFQGTEWDVYNLSMCRTT